MSDLGHVLIMHEGKFYFIPAENISPAIQVSQLEQEKLLELIEEIKTDKKAGEIIDFAMRVTSSDHLIRICGRN
jgi:hypothetical protein